MSWAKKLSRPLEELSEQALTLSSVQDNIEFFNKSNYTEIKQLSQSLNYAVSEMKKGKDLQKELLQNLTHEMKTPLTIVKNYSELLLDYENDEKAIRSNLEIISNEVNKLNILINDIITLSKLQSKTQNFEDTNFNLSETIINYEKSLKLFNDKNIKFNFDIERNIKIFADKTKIEQVFNNLFENAIKYSHENGLVDVKLKNNNNEFIITIKDYGFGINEKDAANIFDRSFRGVNTRKKVAGTGIGLAIVKEILDRYDYLYYVTSKEKRFTEFKIIFRNN